MAGWVDEVLQFWFVALRPKDWWSGTPEVDAIVRHRFDVLLESLGRDPPDAVSLDARGHVAAILVFDQFPRHIHRGSALAFATDPLALALTLDAIDRKLDDALSRNERHFLYLPLMHAEDADVQARSLTMFERLADRGALRSAIAHRKTFARFGRFPYRNAALGRISTAEEKEFLAHKHELA